MSTAPAKTRSEELAPLRPVRLGPASVEVERKPDSTILLRSPRALEPYPEKLTKRLAHWARLRRAHFPRAAQPAPEPGAA